MIIKTTLNIEVEVPKEVSEIIKTLSITDKLEFMKLCTKELSEVIKDNMHMKDRIPRITGTTIILE